MAVLDVSLVLRTLAALSRRVADLENAPLPPRVPGPRGSPGPAGAAGAAGPVGPPRGAYDETFPSASTSWTVNHNLGIIPAIVVRSLGGVEVDAEVQHTSLNQTLIQFSAPFAGSVSCR